MSYWDTSALMPLFVDEATSAAMQALHGEDPEPATSWLTVVECWSTAARLVREGRVTESGAEEARAVIATWAGTALEITLTEGLRVLAGRLLRRLPLRAGDAIHLAAALVWAKDEPRGRSFICLDRRLRAAAAAEGFRVLPADWWPLICPRMLSAAVA